MPTIKYPKNPNIDTAFVEQDDGTKNRALMVAPQDISTLELPNNPNSTKGYVTIDGKKQRVILTADISGAGGGGDQHNLGWYATQAALEEAHPTAEAGDWAIVGATDTVWIWDTDNSAWVDSDQKGQVTSVNNHTGAVTLDINDIAPTQTGKSGYVLGTDGFVAGWVEPEIVQRDTMPQADENEVGNIYQFIGTTDANYTNGYFYKCVSDGQTPATYSWTRVDVQPTPSELPTQTGNSGKFLTTDGSAASWATVGGLPSQTGNSGKFLTTDGTDASWATINALTNTATGTDALTILGTSSTGIHGLNIGTSSSGNGVNAVAIGYSSVCSKGNSVSVGAFSKCDYNGGNATAIGEGSRAAQYGTAIGMEAFAGVPTFGSSYNDNAIAIGWDSKVLSNNSIQIGKGTNSDPGTFCVGSYYNNAYVNYKLLDSDGTIPKARLANMATVPATAPELAVADWSSNTQTITVTGVTASNVVLVSPAPASAADYAAAGIICTAQATDSLTFTCTTVPTNAITLSVVIL